MNKCRLRAPSVRYVVCPEPESIGPEHPHSSAPDGTRKNAGPQWSPRSGPDPADTKLAGPGRSGWECRVVVACRCFSRYTRVAVVGVDNRVAAARGRPRFW